MAGEGRAAGFGRPEKNVFFAFFLTYTNRD